MTVEVVQSPTSAVRRQEDEADSAHLLAGPRRATCIFWVRTAALLGILSVLAIFAYQIHYVILGANFHVIREGMLYRSATLREKELRQLVATNRIRSVINLRGACPDFPWYVDETRTLQEQGVIQYDVNFSSCLVPGKHEMEKLVKALDGEPPLLIHCRRGSDRTGLAAALALLLRTDTTLVDAKQQLSLRFGHLEFSRSGTLHQVLRQYETWLATSGQAHSPGVLREWLLHDYKPGPYWAEIEPLQVPGHLEVRTPELARFRVHNRSDYPWEFKQSSSSGFHLQYLLKEEPPGKAYVGGAGYFDQLLQPGQSIELAFSLPAVSTPGRYVLHVDMAEEGRCWFFLLGSPHFETTITVGDPDSEHHKKRKHGK